jgi:hypothetical protein
MCVIRRGHTAEKRAELARRLVGACREVVGLRDDNLILEFTQRDIPYAGLSDDWAPDEPGKLSS